MVEESMLVIDNEVKEILDDHTERIGSLETTTAVMNEKLNNIVQTQSRIETTVLQGQNSILQTLQQLVLSKDKTEISKNSNKTSIIVQLLILAGTFIGAFFANK